MEYRKEKNRKRKTGKNYVSWIAFSCKNCNEKREFEIIIIEIPVTEIQIPIIAAKIVEGVPPRIPPKVPPSFSIPTLQIIKKNNQHK